MVNETFSGWIRLALALLASQDRSDFAHHDRKEAVIFKLRHYRVIPPELMHLFTASASRAAAISAGPGDSYRASRCAYTRRVLAESIGFRQ